ncbi:MAG: hypothetical protein J2P16_00105 [Mycobacterium sp.]|nr:hypothetical protein [Mycobacterium sp.]
MTWPQDLIIDKYASLSHKAVIGESRFDPAEGGFPVVPSWVPASEHRRLTAYKLLAAYAENVARGFLNTPQPRVQAARREYGDAHLIADRIVSGVLGDSVTIAVHGADQPPPVEPDLPDEPDEPGPGAPEPLHRVYDIAQKRWLDEVNEAVDKWQSDIAAFPGLKQRQDQLRDWADDEGLLSKLVEAEFDAVTLGDGVLTVAWSSVKQRPIVTVFDPGFYFPVLEEGAASSHEPDKVHLAWEYEDTTYVPSRLFVRRLTWELVDTPPHSVPWRTEAVEKTCLFSDGTWQLADIEDRRVPDLSPAAADYATNEDGEVMNRFDLGIDFVPVVHIPNGPASREYFGQSSIAHVAQILDDLQSADTDIADTSRKVSAPMVVLSGATTEIDPATGKPRDLSVAPGSVVQVGPNGSMDVLDLSAGLATQLDNRQRLLDRIGMNGKVPPEILGRVASSQAVSGVVLALSFGPFQQTIEKMRLVRKPRHRTLLRYVQRFFQLGGIFDTGPDYPASLALGSYLPSDRGAAAADVAKLISAKAISKQSGVTLLVDAGFGIDDAHHEVDRIRADDPGAAYQVAEATGSEELAADWLGLDLPERPPPPQMQPPATLPPLNLPGGAPRRPLTPPPPPGAASTGPPPPTGNVPPNV